MDLQLYLRVLSRFRVLIFGGLFLAFVLAVFSYVRVGLSNGSPKLAYRQTQLFQSDSKVFVTQKGFPWGRTTPQYVTTKRGSPPVPAADLTRLGNLTVLYAELAKGDQVQRMMGVRGPNARPIDVTTLPGPAFS